jgi:hypothetical protein
MRKTYQYHYTKRKDYLSKEEKQNDLLKKIKMENKKKFSEDLFYSLFKVLKEIYCLRYLSQNYSFSNFKISLKKSQSLKKNAYLSLKNLLNSGKSYNFHLIFNSPLSKELKLPLTLKSNSKLKTLNEVSFFSKKLKSLEVLIKFLAHNQERAFQLVDLEKARVFRNFRNYGILKIDINFVNYNLMLTTLDGKILKWIKAGSDKKQTRRTRFNSRAIGGILQLFFKRMKNNYFKRLKMKYIKIELTGPSRKFGKKLVKMIKLKTSKKFKFRVLCVSEGFRRSFNGCRLTRKKR